jgi:urease accessory protein
VADLRAGRDPADGAALFPVLTPMRSVLDLLQLADSAFPSGAYAHSLGLEALYVDGDGAPNLEAHLRYLLADGLGRVELPMVRAAFWAETVAELRELDGLMDVLLPVREWRSASRSIGRGFRRAAARIQPLEAAVEHHPVVFGAVLRTWDIELLIGLEVYGWQGVRQQLSAAQRLGKIGQSAMQDLLHRLKPAIRQAARDSLAVSRDQMGGFAPRLELAGMAHAHQAARLFLS